MLYITVILSFMSTGKKERLERKKFFNTTYFTLAIIVTNALFGTTVVLEQRRKFGDLMSYQRNSLRDFAINELYQREEREVL